MSIFCIVDGMTEGPEAAVPAAMPVLNRLAKEGAGGTFVTTPSGFQADSFVCILTLLGLPKEAIPTGGRAWLEALGAGIAPAAEDLVLRVSLVSLEEGRLSRLGCPGLSSRERRELARRFGLHPLGGYKHLWILPGAGRRAAEYHSLPPHQWLGQRLTEVLPPEETLRQMILESRDLLEGKAALFPWGASSQTLLPTLPVRCGAVCRTEIVAGIARGMGMAVHLPPSSTGDTDTDLAAKVEAALALAKRLPLVLLHINGADEAAHRKDREEKEAFLGQVDRLVLEPLAQSGLPLLVTSDHATSCRTGGHLGAPQPFALWRGEQRGNLGQLAGTTALQLLPERMDG